jgi:hypothetical protein
MHLREQNNCRFPTDRNECPKKETDKSKLSGQQLLRSFGKLTFQKGNGSFIVSE